MHALIDGDIFAYEFGNAKATNGIGPLPWPFVVSRLDARITNILQAVTADTYQLYITGDGNFREQVATIQKYKGHRPSEKPYWYQHIRQFLMVHRNCIKVDGIEADDILGIEQVEELKYNDRYDAYTVICSRDKDLDMIPGWHYSWAAGNQKEKPLWWQDEISALHSFYCQLLTGDRTDNIPGLYGIGNTSKLLDTVRSSSTELEMYEHVREQYHKRFGSYWKQFLIENARLLWILREHGEDVKDRLDKLEQESINNEELF